MKMSLLESDRNKNATLTTSQLTTIQHLIRSMIDEQLSQVYAMVLNEVKARELNKIDTAKQNDAQLHSDAWD